MSLINDFLSLIYPRSCGACGNNLFKHERFLCSYCLLNLPKSNFHLSQHHELSRLLAGRIPFSAAASLYVFEKGGRVQNMLHTIKYRGQKELAEFLGKEYARELTVNGTATTIQVIIPVPLHRNRLKQRGFNQSEWFAKGLASGLNLPIETGLLLRHAETATQTRKRKYQRWENVEGIFSLKEHHELKNKHVLLVDDVITTGATIEAAWQGLKHVEGIKISVVAIAFAKKY